MSIRKVSDSIQMTGIEGESYGRMNGSLPAPCHMPEAFISPPDLLAVTQHLVLY
ncbi:MAG TPA: hypothetical protein VGK10_04620 [Prolixibacteraceae bacterium]|jgi:hypothetical protein